MGKISLTLLFLFGSRSVFAETTFVFAHIKDKITPISSSVKYEDPLDEMLIKRHIGEVTGGGTQLTENKEIECVGIDIELENPEKNIVLVLIN